MELRLGELLLREKLITPQQLEEALRNQVVYGIRLGSALMEMGYVAEGDLTRVLGEKLGVPCAGCEELTHIPREVIHDFSPALVIRYHVMPFRLERNRLGLAMADPNDLRAIEEIAFITGHVVQPFIAPEVRISHAQATYYRIGDGTERYRRIAPEPKGREDAPGRERGETVAVSARSETGETLQVLIPAEFEDFASLNDDLAPEGQPGRQGEIPLGVERICREFAAARSRDDVAETLNRYLGCRFGSGALFVLRGTVAVGWRGVNKGAPLDDLGSLSLMMDRPSVLRDVTETGAFVLGPPNPTPENRRILQVLDLPGDSSLFVAPLVLRGKVEVVALVSAEMDDPGPALDELQTLLEKAALAFEMLMVRNRILKN